MRHYRYATPAARDARAERRMERAAELGPCRDPRDDNRAPGRLLLEVNGQRIDIELRPDQRYGCQFLGMNGTGGGVAFALRHMPVFVLR